MTNRLGISQCPLCESQQSILLGVISYADIWSNLKSEWEATFSEDVKLAHTPSEAVGLRECGECRLQYFFPACSGSEEFYSQLTSSSLSYYNEEKWEFGFVRELLRPSDSVLDVACGSGAFLASIRETNNEVIGVETNPHAVEAAAKRGVRVEECSIQDFSTKHEGEFEIVTAFQVIEHLDSVLPFISSAYGCAKAGGLLVVSVPNRLRRNRNGFESLDHPPHHISRWTEEQFVYLAKVLGASLESIAKEPLSTPAVVGALRTKEIEALLPLPFYGRRFVIKALSRGLLTFPFSQAFYSLGMHNRLGMYAASLIGLLRKPC